MSSDCFRGTNPLPFRTVRTFESNYTPEISRVGSSCLGTLLHHWAPDHHLGMLSSWTHYKINRRGFIPWCWWTSPCHPGTLCCSIGVDSQTFKIYLNNFYYMKLIFPLEHTQMPSYLYGQDYSKITLSILPISLIRIGLYLILLILTLQTEYQIST